MTFDDLIGLAKKQAETVISMYGTVSTVACLVTRSDKVHMIAMPDMSEQDARYAVTEQAVKHDGVLVAVTHEAWIVSIPDNAPADVRERLELAALTHTLDQQPERREIVILYVEGENEPIRRFTAVIIRDEQGARLAHWEEDPLRLPRPTFRRYLVEHRDGSAIAHRRGFAVSRKS